MKINRSSISFYKSVLKHFWPLWLSLLTHRLILQTDLIMVSPLGTAETAAYGIPLRVMIIDMVLAFAVAPALSVLVAKARSGTDKLFEKASTMGLIWGGTLLIIGLVVYPQMLKLVGTTAGIESLAADALFYLTLAIPFKFHKFVLTMCMHGRGFGNFVFGISLFELIANAALNYLLIYQLGFGFQGSYIATFFLSILTSAITIFFATASLNFRFLNFAWDLPWIKDFIKLVRPELIRISSERLAAYLLLAIVTGFENIYLLSAFVVIMEFQLLLLSLLTSFMRAVGIVAAKLELKKEPKLLRDGTLGLLLISLLIGGLVWFLHPKIAVSVYQLTGEAFLWWDNAIVYLLLTLPFYFADALLRGFLHAQQMFTTIKNTDLIRDWVVLLPVCFYGQLNASAEFVWLGIFASAVAAYLINFWHWNKVSS